MIEKNQKSLGKRLGWNTKFFTLLAFIIVAFSFAYDNIELGIAIGSVAALIVVLIVDYSEMLSHNHPRTWKSVKIIVIALIILLTLIGSIEI